MRVNACFICKLVTALILVIAVIVCGILLGVVGWTNLFYGESFDTFRWPSYADVRQQVVFETFGKPPTIPLENQWSDHKTIIVPKCDVCGNNKILIIVKTAADRLERRNAIRKTWGKIKKFENMEIRTIFVMGKLRVDDSENYPLFVEPALYDDLIIGNFIDNYYNNTLKFIHSIKFVHNNCKNVPFVLLLDDDYMLSIKNLVGEVRKHLPSNNLYMGWKFGYSFPNRNTGNKHWVSLEEYPFLRYPPYITAGAVLLSSKTVENFYYGVQHVKLYKFDDIFTAILAYKLNITPEGNEKFKYDEENPATQSFEETIAAHGYDPEDIIEQNFRVNFF